MRQEDELSYPSLFLVKDIKSIHYKFNLDAIRQEHLHKNNDTFNDSEFIGYKVFKTTTLYKRKSEGTIDKILSFDDKNFPRIVSVLWDDNQYSIEEVINYVDTSDELLFFCPFCKTKLVHYFQNRKLITCSNCNKHLWDNFNSIPILDIQEKKQPFEFNHSIKIRKENEGLITNLNKNKDNKVYRGKFSLEDKINRGQSPGARLSVTEQYFFVSRYYNIRYGLFARYLNLFLENFKISKSSLTKQFPTEYKHTKNRRY